ncbi:MAG: oxidoreductase [Acidobacteria bacterium]|nr:oxidoreductase [Acidobacteriota bacterium]
MKNVFLALGVAAAAFHASAAPADQASLVAYAKRALPKCTDSAVKLNMVPVQGPAGFQPYELTQTSSDPSCGSQKVLLYSPATQQVLIGTIFALPTDARPVDQRIADQASQLLKLPMTATVSAFPLPDRIRAVAMTKKTQYGNFSYHGYVDGSDRFLIIGTRGNLRGDPGKALLEALNAKSAGVWRGTKAARNEIVELSDFQCPTCGRAHKTLEPVVSKHLKNVHYARLDLPLFEHHEWAFPAAMGSRAIQRVAPDKYWSYVDFMFQNQENISKAKSFDEVLKNFAEDHDMNWKAIEKIYRDPAERQALMDQVSLAFDNGIVSTPTYIINGQVMGYGPEGKTTIDAVKAAVGAK